MRRREHGAPHNQTMSHMVPSSPTTRPIRPFDCAIDPSKVHQVQPIQRSSTDHLNPLGRMFGATNANAMERNTAGCDNLVGSWSSVMRNVSTKKEHIMQFSCSLKSLRSVQISILEPKNYPQSSKI